jgi:hypothetical protein
MTSSTANKKEGKEFYDEVSRYRHCENILSEIVLL